MGNRINWFEPPKQRAEPKRILWMSRHQPLAVEIDRLRKIFGEVEVRQDSDPFSNAEDIKGRFDQGGYDDIVVVAPWSVIDHLCRLGLRPLWSQMDEVHSAPYDLRYNGRLYRFIRFRRVTGVTFHFEEVE